MPVTHAIAPMLCLPCAHAGMQAHTFPPRSASRQRTFMPSAVCTRNTSSTRPSSLVMDADTTVRPADEKPPVMLISRCVLSLPSTVTTVHSSSLMLSNWMTRASLPSREAIISTADAWGRRATNSRQGLSRLGHPGDGRKGGSRCDGGGRHPHPRGVACGGRPYLEARRGGAAAWLHHAQPAGRRQWSEGTGSSANAAAPLDVAGLQDGRAVRLGRLATLRAWRSPGQHRPVHLPALPHRHGQRVCVRARLVGGLYTAGVGWGVWKAAAAATLPAAAALEASADLRGMRRRRRRGWGGPPWGQRRALTRVDARVHAAPIKPALTFHGPLPCRAT